LNEVSGLEVLDIGAAGTRLPNSRFATKHGHSLRSVFLDITKNDGEHVLYAEEDINVISEHCHYLERLGLAVQPAEVYVADMYECEFTVRCTIKSTLNAATANGKNRAISST
jgi:hypothetical protein